MIFDCPKQALDSHNESVRWAWSHKKLYDIIAAMDISETVTQQVLDTDFYVARIRMLQLADNRLES